MLYEVITGKGIGDPIEIVGHFQVRIIDRIVGAIGSTAPQRGDAGSRQIVSVNVIGPHVLFRQQRWQATFEAGQRQAIGGIDSRRSQDADGNAATRPPGSQAALGIV